MRKILFSLLFCMAISPSASAQRLEQIFTNANQAYFESDFDKSIDHYQKLIQSGVDDPDVYFNLATAYARAGKCGWAILYFERSLKIQAANDAAEAGLAACRTLLGKEQAERQGEAVVQTKPSLSQALIRPFSEDLLAWLLLLFNLGFFSVLIAYRLVSKESVRVGLGVAAPLLGLLLLITGASLLQKMEIFEEGHSAVVVSKNPSLREGPDPRASIRSKAQEGQSVRVLSQEGEYVRIRLFGGEEGWIKKDDVGII